MRGKETKKKKKTQGDPRKNGHNRRGKEPPADWSRRRALVQNIDGLIRNQKDDLEAYKVMRAGAHEGTTEPIGITFGGQKTGPGA